MIPKTGLQAFRALAVLACLPEGKWTGIDIVAKAIDTPPSYVGKLLRGMVEDGLVVSRKGHGGGFRLARDPRKIRLLDVLDPIEPVSRLTDCLLGEGQCSSDKPCSMHDRWEELRTGYMKLLTETTVADLVQSPRRATVEIETQLV